MHDTSDCCAGGGLYRSFPSERSVVRGCKFIKNKAAQYGGAIYEQNVADGAVQASRSHYVQPLFRGHTRCNTSGSLRSTEPSLA